MSAIRVACTAVGKRINAGRVNKEGDAFIGNPVDVTSDCLKAVIEKVGAGQVVTVTEDGKPAFEIEVRDVRLAAPLPAEQPSNPVPLTDADRLLHIAQFGLDPIAFAGHVLNRGGNGDLSDIRSHIDAEMARIVGQQTKGGSDA